MIVKFKTRELKNKLKPKFNNGNVLMACPDCDGAITTFEHKRGNQEFGSIVINKRHNFNNRVYQRIVYKLLSCASCGRGGLAKVSCDGNYLGGVLEDFFPVNVEHVEIPQAVPVEISKEFREAELCSAFGASRAASALFRSTLEKTLKANGYNSGNLENKINKAAEDGIITSSRQRRAHDDIRVLGNDVLHDEWKEIAGDDVEKAHHYIQRILEDFYDDRSSVETILISKSRISK